VGLLADHAVAQDVNGADADQIAHPAKGWITHFFRKMSQNVKN
jgi:hypothetical protein